MKNLINKAAVSGYLYGHDLEKRTTGAKSKNPGTEYISGNIEIATDNEGINVVPVHFTYVTERTAAGRKNRTYDVLSNIIDGCKTWVDCGADCDKYEIQTAVALNEFVDNNSSDKKLVSVPRLEGGFVNKVKGDIKDYSDNERNSFEVDMLINGVREVEEDPEKGEAHHVMVKGAIFNFRKELLPISFRVDSEQGIAYILQNMEDASPSNMTFTKVWGKVISATIKQRIEEELAFGEPMVTEVTKRVKRWKLVGFAAVPYDFGDEAFMTEADVTKLSQERNLKVAEIKQRNEDYLKSRNETATVAVPVEKKDFSF